MEDFRTHATSLKNEEDWIEKYRAAVAADLNQRTASSRRLDGLGDFVRDIVLSASRVARWAHWALEKGHIAARTGLSRLRMTQLG